MPPDATTPQHLIRPSSLADVAAMAAIYNGHLHRRRDTGTGSSKTEAPTEAELARRRDEVLAKGLPWLVVQTGCVVMGYA